MKKFNSKKYKDSLKNVILSSTFVASIFTIGGMNSKKTDVVEPITVDYSASNFVDYKKNDNNIFKESLKEVENEKTEEALIKYYSDVYSLDYNIVYNIISDLTNEFTDENYINNNVIGDSTMKNKYVDCESKDLAILIAVRNIFYLHDNYGYSADEIKTTVEFESGLSYSAQIAKSCDVIGVDKCMAYAISDYSCDFENEDFNSNNNPASITFSSELASFPSKEAGFIELGLELLKYNMAGNETVADISTYFAPNSTKWIDDVTASYELVSNSSEDLFSYESSDDVTVVIVEDNELEVEELELEVEELKNDEYIIEDNHFNNFVLNGFNITDKEIYEDLENVYVEEDIIEISEEERLIKYYCEVYSLDYNLVYNTLYNLTEGFQSENYINNNMIGTNLMKGKNINCDTKEFAILIAVRSIYYSSSNYGLSFNNINTGIEYYSDLSYEAQIAKASDVVGIDKLLAYSISRYETGFSSNLFKNKNNPAGIRFSAEWASFPSKQAGFIELALEVLKYNLNGKYTPAQIGVSYAPTSDPTNNGWVNNVTNIYSQALNFDHSVFCYSETCNEPDYNCLIRY